MIDDLLKNETFLRWFPLAAGIVFISVFISLGFWQLDRAVEKESMLSLFESNAQFVEPSDFGALETFDRIRVFGRYRDDRQVLIDNIAKEGQLGYYVITPFEPTISNELLLINRGWLPKTADVDLTIDDESRTVRGLAGNLPLVTIRPGEAFAEHGNWPRVALYPTIEEVAAELDEELLPKILLLHPDAEDGFVRRWEPDVGGPMTHYSYAFQWFAMAVVASSIAGWQTYKRFSRERADS
ncbi:MAG: SURF1 family protein [Woeseiaceae bacterium]